MSISQAVSYVFYLMFFVLAAWAVYAVKQRASASAEQQRMADAAFEAQMLAMARASSNAANDIVIPATLSAVAANDLGETAIEPNHTTTSDTLDIPSPFSTQATQAALTQHQGGDDFYRQAADITCARVISQLTSAGICEDREGFLELNGNAKGAVIMKMRNGKRALVLPYWETEPFTLRNLKRFDMIVSVGRNGKAVVLSSLEEVIASRVSGTMSSF